MSAGPSERNLGIIAVHVQADVVSHRFEADLKEFSVNSSLLCFRMSSMSALFKLSMWIRVFAYISTFFYPQYDTELFLKCFSCLLFQHGHGYLTENLGIPVWGSYAVFGLATLFLGMVLGLVSEALGTDCDCVTLVLPPPQFWAGLLGYPELGHRDGEQDETPHNPGAVRLDGIHPLDKELNSHLKSLFQPK